MSGALPTFATVQRPELSFLDINRMDATYAGSILGQLAKASDENVRAGLAEKVREILFSEFADFDASMPEDLTMVTRSLIGLAERASDARVRRECVHKATVLLGLH